MMLHRFLAFVMLFSPLAAQTPVRKPLTLTEALALLEQRNLTAAAARFHLDATRSQQITAGLRPNPVFNSLNEDFNVFDPKHFDPNTDWTQNVSYLIERGGKRQRRIESASLATRVASEQFNDGLRQLRLQTKLVFTSVLLAKASLELSRQNLADYSRTVELSQIRYQAGDISRTELDRIVLQRAKFEVDLLTAQTALSQASAVLQFLIGEPEIAKDFDIEGTLDVPTLMLGFPELLSRALATRPDYHAAIASVTKADADYRLAKANGATDVSVGGEFKRSGTDSNLGITLTIPLRVFDRNQGEKARTQSEFRASQSAERSARLQVETELYQAWIGYENAVKLAALYKTDYSQRATLVRDRVQFSYRNGGTSLLDYIEAMRDYRDTQLAALTTQSQVWNAIHQLSFAAATELIP
ncbi:MAG: TolC family protein [Acidobacteriaceae bacterium]